MQLNCHPAPGLKALLPGWWSVPNNPVSAALQPITRTPGIAEILPAAYVVPQNPIRDYVNGQTKMIGQGGCGCGGSCGCSDGGTINGMSGFSEDFDTFTGKLTSGAVMEAIQVPIFGIPVWGYAAGLLALVMFAGSKGKR